MKKVWQVKYYEGDHLRVTKGYFSVLYKAIDYCRTINSSSCMIHECLLDEVIDEVRPYGLPINVEDGISLYLLSDAVKDRIYASHMRVKDRAPTG